MNETSSRLLTLLSLLQARRDWPGAELASRLEVSGRTIRRDVERLRDLGYPVESLTGPAGGYTLRAGTAMPPLLLDDDEAIAIAVGLRTAAKASVTGIEEAAVRALVKLEQVLPSRLRRRVAALGQATITMPGGGPTVDPQDLTTLAACCRDLECLRFAYTGRDGAESRREVEPHSVVNLGRRWYLVAWDRKREDWRTFRVDRLERPASMGVRFTARKLPAKDAAAYVTESIRATAAPLRGGDPGPRLRRGGPPPLLVGRVRAGRRRDLRVPDGRRRPPLAGDAADNARPRLRGHRGAAGAPRAPARGGAAGRARGDAGLITRAERGWRDPPP